MSAAQLTRRLVGIGSGQSYSLSELSGSLGDLGTFIPLVVTLVAQAGLDMGTVLLFAGIYSVVTGILFEQPIAVQPMKAIAAVAIVEGMSAGALTAAGVGMGVALSVLALSGLISQSERWVPVGVVRGIQLGYGLKLAFGGLAMGWDTPWLGLDSRATALLALCVVLATQRLRKFPSALMLLALGTLMLFAEHPELPSQLQFGWAGPVLVLPSVAEWQDGLLRGTLPQLPLTLLNSVLAVCALSAELFPGRGVGVRSMALSVAAMNLVGPWFGALPMCHGSGGLAGQYRFGARTGASMRMLGGLKILMALCFGTATLVLLRHYPSSILGALLVFAGLQLAQPARKSRGWDGYATVAVTAAGIVAFHALAGFALGMLVAWLSRAAAGAQRR